MQNNLTSVNGLQQLFSNSMQQLADTSVKSMRPMLDGILSNFSAVTKSATEGTLPVLKMPKLSLQSSNCCAPEKECPPHCLTSISRCAMQGERIVVPFLIKNTCSKAKTYRIGLRELKDEDGQMAPTQPSLNKYSVTLEPSRSERVLMTIDLGNYSSGTKYTAEIVLREKDINQNICFTLIVDDDCYNATAEPQDEQKYKLRWQSWKDHFYCEPPAKRQLQPQG